MNPRSHRPRSGPLSADLSLDLPEFAHPPAEPMRLARNWLADADVHGVREPLSMTLATATRAGYVSARTVDVKAIDDDGLVFGTSAESPTGFALADNPNAALQVYWRETMEQLRFEGRVIRLDASESDALFAARTPQSRAATAVSEQSMPFPDDAERTLATLIADANVLLAEYGDAIPRPDTWWAYRLVPDAVEFWHGSRDRMHRRLRFLRDTEGWQVDRLEP
jgi:dihydrophenazinedicarboxylate synthase